MDGEHAASVAGRRPISLRAARRIISYTLHVPLDAGSAWPDELTPRGRLINAIDLRLVAEGLHLTAMVQALIVDPVSSDLASSAESFVAITIMNRDMTDDVAGATLQRVLEIETYVDLPVAFPQRRGK